MHHPESMELMEEAAGTKLHRNRLRTLTAFRHVEQGPLIDVLFSITRPTLHAEHKNIAERAKAARAADEEAARLAPVVKIVRRGMVNYRRERYGLD